MNQTATTHSQKFPFKFKFPNSPQRLTTAANVKSNNVFPINLNHFHPFQLNSSSVCSNNNSTVNDPPADQVPETTGSKAYTTTTDNGSSPQLHSFNNRPLSRDMVSNATPNPEDGDARAPFVAIQEPIRQPDSDFNTNQSTIHPFMNTLTPIPEEIPLDPRSTPPPFNSDTMAMTLSDHHSDPLHSARDTHIPTMTRPMKRPKLSIGMDPGTITGAIDQLVEARDYYQLKSTKLESDLLHSNTRAHSLQQQLHDAQMKNVKLSNDLNLAQTSHKLVQQNLKTHSDQLQDYQAIRAQLSDKVSEFDQFKDTYSVKVNQLQAELNTAMSERDQLIQQLDLVKEHQKSVDHLESKMIQTSESVCSSVQQINTGIDSVRALVQENVDHHANLQFNMDSVLSLANDSVSSISSVVPQVSDRIEQLESHVIQIVPEVSSILTVSNNVVKGEICTALNDLSKVVHQNMTDTYRQSDLLRSELEDLKLKESVLSCKLDQARNRIHQFETEVKQLEVDLVAAKEIKTKELDDLQNQIQVLNHDNQILVQDMANLQETHTNEIRILESKHTQAVHEQELLTQSLNASKQALESVPLLKKLSDLHDQLSTCLAQTHAMSDQKFEQVLDVAKHNQYRMGQVEERMVGRLEQLWSLSSDDMRKLHMFFVESSGASEDRRRRDIAQVLDEVTKVTDAMMAVHDHVPAAVVTRILDKCVTENLIIGTNTSASMHNNNGCGLNGRSCGGGKSPNDSTNSMGSKEDAFRYFNMQALHPLSCSKLQMNPLSFGSLTTISDQYGPIAKECDSMLLSNVHVSNPDSVVNIPPDNITSSSVSSTSSATGYGIGLFTEKENTTGSQLFGPVESPVQGTIGKLSAVKDPFAFPNLSSPSSPKHEHDDEELIEVVQSKLPSKAAGNRKSTTTRTARVPGAGHQPNLKSPPRTAVTKRVQFASLSRIGSQCDDDRCSNSDESSDAEGTGLGNQKSRNVLQVKKRSTPVRTSRSKRK